MDDVSSSERVSCAECGRSPGDEESLEAQGWRYLPAGVEEPHAFCQECAEREFGPPPA
jgi:hypothetical protein